MSTLIARRSEKHSKEGCRLTWKRKELLQTPDLWKSNTSCRLNPSFHAESVCNVEREWQKLSIPAHEETTSSLMSYLCDDEWNGTHYKYELSSSEGWIPLVSRVSTMSARCSRIDDGWASDPLHNSLTHKLFIRILLSSLVCQIWMLVWDIVDSGFWWAYD